MTMPVKWEYKNNTDKVIVWRNTCWGLGETKDICFPVPEFLGLTCIQEGTMPDPVLFHDDLLIPPNSTEIINLTAPLYSGNISLTLLCIGQGGVECRFNSESNNPIPIDIRGFSHIIPWEMCARIYLKNTTEAEAHISVSAIEVCV